MEHDEAFWRVVDVANLERLLAEAEAAAAGVDGKIEQAGAHLAAAKAAKADALEEVARLRAALDQATEKADEIPGELAATVNAEVSLKNRVRAAVAQAMAGVAEATGEANGAS